MGITKATPTTPPATLGVLPVKARGRQKASTLSILQAAEALFDRQGYANTTMEQIVQQLGVTKPYVYYYFHNKQEIFETLCWRPSVACFTAMDFPEDDLRPAHTKVAEGMERLILAMQKKLASHFYDRMCALMEEARREGTLDFKETRLTALAACSLPGFLYHWYRPDGRLSPAEVVRELSQLAWRVLGLRAQGEAADQPVVPKAAGRASARRKPAASG